MHIYNLRNHFKRIVPLACFALINPLVTADTTITLTPDPDDVTGGTISISGGNGAGLNDPGIPNVVDNFALQASILSLNDGEGDSMDRFGVPEDTNNFVIGDGPVALLLEIGTIPIEINGVASTLIQLGLQDSQPGDDLLFMVGNAVNSGGDPRVYSIPEATRSIVFPGLGMDYRLLVPGSFSRVSSVFGDTWTLTIIGLPQAPAEAGIVAVAQSGQGSPSIIIIPQSTVPQQVPDPITIIDVGAQLSAETSGQAVINTVSQGGRGTFNGFSNNVSSHLNGLTGLGGFGNGGFSIFHQSNKTLNMQIAGAAGRWNGSSSITAGVVSEPIVDVNTFAPKWEIYTMGAFNRQDQDQIGLDPGFTGNSWSGTVGIERIVSRNLLIGFAATMGRNNLEAGGNSGSADVDGLVLDAYALYTKNQFWSSLRYGWGDMDVEVTRNAFPGVTTRADTDSENHVISWGAGLNLPVSLFGMEFLHGPNVGLDYTTGSNDGYTERGGGAFNLIVNDHAYGSLVSEVGWSIAKQHELAKLGRGFLQLRAGWESEHLLDESNTEFQFETSPFSVFDPSTGQTTEGAPVFGAGRNPTPQNDYMTLGLHLTQLLGVEERWVLRGGYQTQLFRSNFSTHYGYLRLGYQF